MKKNIIYTALALVALGATICSCSREEKNLFDKTAAERLQEAENNAISVLTSAPNGWEMQYFPHEDAPGYALLCQFHTNGSVTFAAKNKVSSSNRYAEQTSLWTMSGNQGAVLSLSTYNKLVSIFADPGSDGVGYLGDYEFMVMSANATHISLKGKKHGAKVEMYALPKGMAWSTYYDVIDNINADVFDNNEGVEWLYTCGDVQMSVTYKKDVINYTNDEGDTDYARSFIVTPTGIRFYTGCPASKSDSTIVARNFVLNADKTALVCTDPGINATITPLGTAVTDVDLKMHNRLRWVIDDVDTDAATLAAINAIKAKAKANGAVITRIAYEYYQALNAQEKKEDKGAIYVAYTVDNHRFEGRIDLKYSIANDHFTATYNKASTGLDGLFKRLDTTTAKAVAQFTGIFCDTFEAESYTGSQLNKSQILLSSTKVAGKQIHIKSDDSL